MNRIPIQNHKKMALQTAVLRALYVGGMLSVAVIAPKVAHYLPSPNASKARRKELYRRIAYARASLKHRGLIEDVGGRWHLSKKGHVHIERVLMRDYRVPEPIRWDGKWRMLIFDISERRRRLRSRLRTLLQGAGFVRLQDSVWVYPYPCDEFVVLTRAHLASGVGELRSVVVEALEADQKLREHFRLP